MHHSHKLQEVQSNAASNVQENHKEKVEPQEQVECNDSCCPFCGFAYVVEEVFKNMVEAIEAADKKRGRGDGSVGMFSWLIVAALAGSPNVLLTNPLWVLVPHM
ncbi:hypothetical protein CQW23_07013 [Capsicum baccatum]|uniref:Uncharacterized protein n=1 Tax=Capsicum baccatum TaxID=33114 RepID=A0A2G2X508_CAPBA|nr:hypothetical protein CQW23_07013 [Capsicum baccatum]